MMKVFAVLPCYKTQHSVLDVIAKIGSEVCTIVVVDDHCPHRTGIHVENCNQDPRVTVLFHSHNQGVGGAMLTGYRYCLDQGADVVVKIDSDGQMNPAFLPILIRPLLRGEADYTKGNRFFNIEDVKLMPRVRIFGNAGLSFLTKLSTGYWHIFDPTNGYTAIHCAILQCLPFEKISKGYFFESDMLFRMSTLRAVVLDIPMVAHYENEVSNLNVFSSIFEFAWLHWINFSKRLFYTYFLRDFSIASVQLVVGVILFAFGFIFGLTILSNSIWNAQIATAGTIMLCVLPILVSVQLLIGFLSYDYSTVPKIPFQKYRY
jgi:dolichol-phosphate mannosyltransferase